MLPGVVCRQNVLEVIAAGYVDESRTQFKAGFNTAANPPPWERQFVPSSGTFTVDAGTYTPVLDTGFLTGDFAAGKITAAGANTTLGGYALVSFWFKANTSGVRQNLHYNRSNISAYERYVRIDLDAAGDLYISAKSYAVNPYQLTIAGSWDDGAWHHVCFMHSQGAASAGKYYVFVDNVQVGTRAVANVGDSLGGYLEVLVGHTGGVCNSKVSLLRICTLVNNVTDCGLDAGNIAQVSELYNEMAGIWRP